MNRIISLGIGETVINQLSDSEDEFDIDDYGLADMSSMAFENVSTNLVVRQPNAKRSNSNCNLDENFSKQIQVENTSSERNSNEEGSHV